MIVHIVNGHARLPDGMLARAAVTVCGDRTAAPAGLPAALARRK